MKGSLEKGLKTPSVGDVLGRYRLTEMVGYGGMGAVFKAETLDEGQIVALKILHVDLLSKKDSVSRILTELDLLKRVSHRNVCAVFDGGELPEWPPYIAMEFLEGESLKDCINRRGYLSVSEAMPLMLEVLDGLEAIHSTGIIHRDIKPENILLISPDPETVTVKLLDFGIAKDLDPEAKKLTRTGFVLGTPMYMSPEQLLGLRDLNSQSDLWSVGVLLYEMITGELPFDGNNDAQIIARILHEKPDLPSYHKNNISVEIEQVIVKALEKDRDERYCTAREFIRDIEQFIDFDSRKTHQIISASGPARQNTTALKICPDLFVEEFCLDNLTFCPAMYAIELSLNRKDILEYKNLKFHEIEPGSSTHIRDTSTDELYLISRLVSGNDNIQNFDKLIRFYKEKKLLDELTIVLFSKVVFLLKNRDLPRGLLFETLGGLAIVYEEKSSIDLAISTWQFILESQPSNFLAHERIISLLLKLSDLDKLEKFFSKDERWEELRTALQDERNRDDISTSQKINLFLREASILSSKLSAHDQALICYEEALRLDPTNITAAESLIKVLGVIIEHIPTDRTDLVKGYRLRLASLYEKPCNDHRRASREFKRVLKVDSSNNQAIDGLERLRKEEDDESAITEFLKRIYEQNRDWNKFLTIIEDLLEDQALTPEKRVDLLKKTATILSAECDDPQRALEILFIALDESPSDIGVREEIENLAFSKNLVPELVEFYKSQIDRTVNLDYISYLHSRVAEFEEDRGNFDSALFHWEKNLSFLPTSSKAADALIRLHRQAENDSKLADAYITRSKLSSDPAAKVNDLFEAGRIFDTQVKDLQKSITIFSRILEIDPGHLDANTYLLDLYERGDNSMMQIEVLESLAGIVQDSDQQIAFYLRASRIYLDHLDNETLSSQMLCNVIDLQPQNRDAIKGLEALLERCDKAETKRRNAASLSKAYSSSDDRDSLLMVLGVQLEHTTDLVERAELLRWRNEVLLFSIREKQQNSSIIPSLGGLGDFTERRSEIVGYELELEDASAELMSLYNGLLGADDALPSEQQVDYLLSRSWVLENCLKDEASAMQGYFEALERDSSNAVALSRLSELLPYHENWERYAIVLKRRVDLSGDADEKEELNNRLAQIYEEHLGDYGEAFALYKKRAEEGRDRRAINALERLFLKGYHREEIVDTLGPIYRSTGEWLNLAFLLEGLLEYSDDEPSRRVTERELAFIYDQKIENKAKATRYYESILEKNSDDIQVVDKLISLHESAGNWRRLAETIKRKVELVDSKDSLIELNAALGEIYEVKLGELETAETYFRTIVNDLDPNHGTSLEFLERLYSTKKDWRRRYETLQLRLETITDSAQEVQILRKLGETAVEGLQRMDLGEESWRRLLDIKGYDASACAVLSTIYSRQGEWTKLIELKRLENENVDDAEKRLENLTSLARLLEEKLGRTDEALSCWLSVAELDPLSDDVLGAFKRLARQDAKFGDLIAIYRRKYESGRNRVESFELRRRAALVYEEILGQHSNSFATRLEMLRSGPVDEELMESLIRLSTELGNWRELLRECESQGKDDLGFDNDHYLDVAQGRCWLELGDDESAERFYKKALENADLDIPARLGLVEIYHSRERWVELSSTTQSLTSSSRRDEVPPELLQRFNFLQGEALVNLDRREEALLCYRVAYDLDPIHVPTIRRLAEIYFAEGSWKSAFEFYQMVLIQLLESPNSPELVGVFYSLGRSRQGLGDLKGAVEMLEKALEIHQDDRPALEALVSIYEGEGEWEKVVEFASRLASLLSGRDRFKLLLRLGDIWQKDLNNNEKAIEYYRKSLDVEPKRRNVLIKLLDLLKFEERWDEAVTVLQRMASLEIREKVRAEIYHSIANIFADKTANSGDAITYYNLALDDDSDLLIAFESIDVILTKQRNWSLLKDNYRKMIQRIETHNKPEVEVRLWHFLGEIYRTRIRDFEASIEAFERAIELEPGNLERRRILAELYDSMPDSRDRALEEYHALLKGDPADEEIFRSLKSIYKERDQEDEVWCLCSTLSFLGKANIEEQIYFEEHKPENLIRAQTRLEPKDWIEILASLSEDQYLTEIFSLILELVRSLRSQPGKSLGLKRKERHDPNRSTDACAKAFAYVAQVFDLDVMPELYIQGAGDFGPRYAITDPPASVVGRDFVTGLGQRQLTFEVGRHLSYYHGGSYMRWVEPSTQGLKRLVLDVVKLVRPEFSTSNTTQSPDLFAQRVDKELPASSRQRLNELIAHVMEERSGRIDVKSWARAIEKRACRAGFLVCNDIFIAARMIQEHPVAVEGVSARELERDLVMFSTSREYFELRKKLSLAIE